jgi:two-component system NtrC family sensor kinase
VATYGLVAFGTGGLALLFAAMVTMNFLQRSLLLPLSLIIDADNAARRGDSKHAVVDAGDIPEDEVGAIMRSRNHLFRAMIQAQGDLDSKNAELEGQREELRRWGRELEQLVQDKTAALLRARGILHRTEKLAALGRLSANVAHEINNPLACIAGYAEEAREELTQDEGSDAVIQSLKTIEEQAFRCKDILKRLLGLARADEFKSKELRFGQLVVDTCALSEHSMQKRGVELRLTPREDGGPLLVSDSGSLQQLIMNLLENAIDAACHGEGPPWVEVSVEETPDEIALTVRDSGRGVPDEIMSRVFDPFYTTKPVGRGTGLGLAICQSLVERLGGSIAVESPEGKGAAFTVFLPRSSEPPAGVADGSAFVEEQLRATSATADPGS